MVNKRSLVVWENLKGLKHKKAARPQDDRLSFAPCFCEREYSISEIGDESKSRMKQTHAE